MLKILYFAIPLFLVGGMAAAADLPVVMPLSAALGAGAAPVAKPIKRRVVVSQRKFEHDLLSSPIGHGRLE